MSSESARPSSEQLSVTRNEEAGRFEGHVGDELVGVIDFYRQQHGELVVTHTGTEPMWRGRGIAAELTRSALEDVRSRGELVRPLCPYTIHFLSDHPEFADVLA